jgi:hypothetical protein
MRNGKRIVAGLAFLLASGSVADAAFALDLTGTWQGKWSCTGSDGAKFSDANATSTMLVSQAGNSLQVTMDGGGFHYAGGIIADTAKPEAKGQGVLVNCGTNNSAFDGPEGELIRITVKAKAGSSDVALKGSSIFEGNSPTPYVGSCKYSFRRTDVTDPVVPACGP